MEKVSNLQEYVNYVERYKGTGYFRGQANIEWKIEPKVFRDTKLMENEITTYPTL